MSNRIPETPLTLMAAVYRRVFPAVRCELTYWQKRADQIPDNELRLQALASIKAKRFHCLGGAVYALLAGDNWKQAVRFIVAYQTISDYLDNLCDRSTSLDPDDFRLLHQATNDALTPKRTPINYYELRNEQDDGGYLHELVRTCQQVIQKIEPYNVIYHPLSTLEQWYSDLQVYKHVTVHERIPRLTVWFEKNKDNAPVLSWYEFSAAAGSTLGVFCIISYALGGKVRANTAETVFFGYFPYVQALHILLDYYIDSQEDEVEGDLNFCSFYNTAEHMKERFMYVIQQAQKSVQALPDTCFHEMVISGLVGLYLADPKVKGLDGGQTIRHTFLRASGAGARFFHLNAKLYHLVKKARL